MVNDTLDIMDAKIVNFGIKYSVVAAPSFNSNAVMTEINDRLKDHFDDKLYIGEPIYITKIYQTINRVQGVVDTIKVKARLKQSGNYSNLGLLIDDVLSKDGTFLKCPKNCVFDFVCCIITSCNPWTKNHTGNFSSFDGCTRHIFCSD